MQTNDQYTKPPPNVTEIEQSLLSACLMGDSEAVCEALKPEDFYKKSHKDILTAIKKLIDAGTDITIVTVIESLRECGCLGDCGGPEYVSSLLDIPLAVDIKYYANKVKDSRVKRDLIRNCHEIIKDCYEGSDFETLVDNARSRINNLTESALNIDFIGNHIKEITESAGERYEYIYKNPGITGISTGLPSFDDMTCGLQKTDLLLLAGRTSMGKTAFALNLTSNIAIKNNIPVGIFSLEMSKDQLHDRLASIESGVNLLKFRSGRFDKDDWGRITEAQEKIYNSPIIINDMANTTEEIRRAAFGMKRKYKIELMFLDYLQLVRLKSAERRDLALGELSRTLKLMAKELDIPIIALSQLNRSLDARTEKRPILSDLRDSGSLEQDADLVIFVYRDEVYNPTPENKGVAELLIRKQRNGPTGDVKLSWNDRTTRFYELSRRD